jgi:hypothetical protein
VAEQQGKYLGKKLAKLSASGHDAMQNMDIKDDMCVYVSGIGLHTLKERPTAMMCSMSHSATATLDRWYTSLTRQPSISMASTWLEDWQLCTYGGAYICTWLLTQVDD